MSTTLYGARRPAGRPVALTATVALHVAGILVAWNLGGFQRLLEAPPHSEMFIRNDPVDVEPPPKPDFTPAPVEIPFPLPVWAPPPIDGLDDAPPDSSALSGATTADPPLLADPAPPARQEHVPVVTPLSWTARRSTDDVYPPASIRMSEQGSASVRVCVGANGRLSGTLEVLESSGYPRLDQAALTWTREALVFKPATEDGRAVEACKGFKVTFTLK